MLLCHCCLEVQFCHGILAQTSGITKIEDYIHFLLVINWNVKQLDDLLVPAAGAYTFKNSINQCSLHDLQNNAF